MGTPGLEPVGRKYRKVRLAVGLRGGQSGG